MIKFESEAHFEKFIVDHHTKTGELITHDEEWKYCLQQFKIEGIGIPDLIFINPGQNIPEINQRYLPSLLVVELKNQALKEKDVGQLCRYVSYFGRHLEGVEVRGALVVPESGYLESDACYITDALGESIDLITFGMSVDGINFTYRDGFSGARETKIEARYVLERLNEGYDLACVAGDE